MPFVHQATGTGTDQELLDLTRAAIAKILAGAQSYSVDGRSFTAADIGKLYEMEKFYQARIAQAAAAAAGRGGMAYTVAKFGRVQ